MVTRSLSFFYLTKMTYRLTKLQLSHTHLRVHTLMQATQLMAMQQRV